MLKLPRSPNPRNGLSEKITPCQGEKSQHCIRWWGLVAEIRKHSLARLSIPGYLLVVNLLAATDTLQYHFENKSANHHLITGSWIPGYIYLKLAISSTRFSKSLYC